MVCTRCEGSGFLNIHQVPDPIRERFDATGEHNDIIAWMDSNSDHDVTVCDCCGDGQGWYRIPGEHDYKDNGPNGPYAYNGGLPECN